MGDDPVYLCRRRQRSVADFIPTMTGVDVADLLDLALVDRLSNGKVDLTFGSSLDIFGGTGVKFDELVEADKVAKAASIDT